MAVGRITGPLLKANLLRDGVDLAFETDLLYLDVINGRVGIKTSSPQYDLDVNGTTRTTYAEVTTQADIATFTLSGNTLSSTDSTINLVPGGSNPVVYQGKIVTGNLQLSTNVIETTGTDTDLTINTTGTGQVNINSNVLVNGDLHATGTITADGDITIGDSNTDNVVFNADINSNIIPDVTNTYDLGSDPTTGGKAWRNVYAYNVNSTNTTIADLTVNNDLTVAGVTNLNGDVQVGDTNSDTVTFTSTVNSDIIPAANTTYNLGTTGARWNDGYFNRVQIDNVVIDNNTISATNGDDNLTLEASGTGVVSVPTSDVQFNQELTVGGNFTVTTGTTNLKDVGITGTITQTGDINQTGDFTTSGNTEVTGNITGTGDVVLSDITLTGNRIEVTTADTDLDLRPNGTGQIIFEDIAVENNVFKSTQLNQDIILQPLGTGSVLVDTTQSLIIPVGTTAQRPATGTEVVGMIRYNTDFNYYEGWNGSYWLKLGGVQDLDNNTYITAELTPGANDNIIRFYVDGVLKTTIDASKLYSDVIQTDNLNFQNNTISTIATNTDLNLTTTGVGSVKIGNLKIRNNTITNTVSGAITQFAETGAGYVKVSGTNGVVIPSGTTLEQPSVTETGMIRFNTIYQFVEVFNGVQWINIAGATSGVSVQQATDIGIGIVLALG